MSVRLSDARRELDTEDDRLELDFERPRQKCSTPGCPRRATAASSCCATCEAGLADPFDDGFETFAARRWGIGADGE